MDDVEPKRASVGSVSELLERLAPLLVGKAEIWYRGHRDRTWSLQPSVFRSPSHKAAEEAMLARFRQEAASAGLQYSFDEWGWITFAQHHGVPTRLLDWSLSPLVGLFFASEQERDRQEGDVEEDGELLLIDPRQLNAEAGDDGGGHPPLLRENHDRLENYLPGRERVRGKPLAVVAPSLFDRIRFQTGTFTVTQPPKDGAESDPLSKADSLQRLHVPGASKPVIREQLEVLGITNVSIYRDLDRIAENIKKGHG